jgi:hypothetical protein
MQKLIYLLAAASLILTVGTAYSQTNEDVCKKQVESTIAAIDVKEKATGAKAAANGLTKQEIVEMLKTKTYCETMQEINKKTLK